jgi:hypothetical protein
MYVRLTEGLGGPIPRIISTQSNLWRRMEPIDPRLGEPVTPTAACIAMPRWITPVKHFFFQRLAVGQWLRQARMESNFHCR